MPEGDRTKPDEERQHRRRLWYWREENFLGLAELVKLLAADADFAEFAEYLRLREKGLRHEAFVHLKRFTEDVRNWPLPQRCRIVDRLMWLQHERRSVYDMLPTPIFRELIDPTLDEWIACDPANPTPLRWRGDTDSLRRAVALDPKETIARAKLIARLLSEVEMATHELPWGYLGSPHEDLEKLNEVDSLIQGAAMDLGQQFRQRLNSLRSKIRAFIDTSSPDR